MNEGKVVDLVIGPQEGGPVDRVTEVRAVAGLGLEGDRYYLRHERGEHAPEDEVTFIAIEDIEAANIEAALGLTSLDMRRNIVTRGVNVGALVGQKFRVGEVEIEGLEANPPCRHLQTMAGKPLLKPMLTRGGIRGRIVSGGIIRVGDNVLVPS